MYRELFFSINLPKCDKKHDLGIVIYFGHNIEGEGEAWLRDGYITYIGYNIEGEGEA